MLSLVITQCTVKKNSNLQEGPVRDMYVGRMFSYLKRRSAEKGDDLYVISAKYGLLQLDDVIASYNKRLKSAADIKALALQVQNALFDVLQAHSYEYVYIALSKNYRKVIQPFLTFSNFIILHPDNWGYLFTKFDNY